MDAATRSFVYDRAKGSCEYCLLKEEDDAYSLHIEHIVARKHGGTSSSDNLALACQQCNLHKGANLSGLDPDTGTLTRLFHPREEIWQQHFAFQGSRIVGLTPIGRTTVFVLRMNDTDRVETRRLLGYGK